MDSLLTDISIYWFSDSLTASLSLYKENRWRHWQLMREKCYSKRWRCPLVGREGQRTKTSVAAPVKAASRTRADLIVGE